MRVVSLGDLGLDVVVRIEGEIARGADTAAAVSLSIRTTTSSPRSPKIGRAHV